MLCDLLLATEHEAKQLARSVLSTTAIRLQMGTRRAKISDHAVPVDICQDRMGAFISKYGPVDELCAMISNS